MAPSHRALQSVTGANRATRIKFVAHIDRRPEGHLLRRARDLDLGVLKVGRPCFTFNTSLAEHRARIPAPPEGWGALGRDKHELARYLRLAQLDYQSWDEPEELVPHVPVPHH